MVLHSVLEQIIVQKIPFRWSKLLINSRVTFQGLLHIMSTSHIDQKEYISMVKMAKICMVEYEKKIQSFEVDMIQSSTYTISYPRNKIISNLTSWDQYFRPYGDIDKFQDFSHLKHMLNFDRKEEPFPICRGPSSCIAFISNPWSHKVESTEKYFQKLILNSTHAIGLPDWVI